MTHATCQATLQNKNQNAEESCSEAHNATPARTYFRSAVALLLDLYISCRGRTLLEQDSACTVDLSGVAPETVSIERINRHRLDHGHLHCNHGERMTEAESPWPKLRGHVVFMHFSIFLIAVPVRFVRFKGADRPGPEVVLAVVCSLVSGRAMQNDS